MATPAASAAESQDKGGSKSQIVIVDIDEPQSAQRVRQLCKGKGKLLTRVERIVGDLVSAGTVKSSAQPVVIVVREIPRMPWSFGDDDDDD